LRPSSLRSAAGPCPAGAAAAAQQTFLVPAGFALDEGDSEAFETQPFFAANARFQYVDGGAARHAAAEPSTSSSFRRRLPSSRPVPGADDVADGRARAHGGGHAVDDVRGQYKGGLATQVLGGAFALPDLGAGPLPLPAPWSVLVPFTAAFA
jgi:hypothetical protein